MGGKKKKKKMTDLNASDSNDGDSGSDYAPIAKSESSENSDFKPGSESEDSEEFDSKNLKKRRREATRRSTRERRRKSDDDFVCDDTEDSDDEPRRKKKRGWSESDASESDSDYGKKKKKGGKKKPKATSYFGRKAVTWGKGKKRKQEVSSEDSDDYRPKKKNKKNKIKKSAFDIDAKNIVATSGRRTRGVKIDYSMIEGSDDSDEPKKEEEGPKGKGKGPRKWDGRDDEFTLEESDKEKVEERQLDDQLVREGGRATTTLCATIQKIAMTSHDERRNEVGVNPMPAKVTLIMERRRRRAGKRSQRQRATLEGKR